METQIDTTSFREAPSMGRRQRIDVRVAVLRAIAQGYDISGQVEGWKVAQLARIVAHLGVSSRTVRNAVAELAADGYVDVIDPRTQGYMPTPRGRLALARWEAAETAKRMHLPSDDERS